MFRLLPTMKKRNFLKAMTLNELPPTLYSLMNSKINFNNDNPVKNEELPDAFRSYLFDFNYPLDDEFKADFETNFLRHYMFRRIGFETYTSFKIHLEDKLNQIMGKYNKMLIGFKDLDFLGNVETKTRTLTDARTQNSTSSATSSGSSNTTSDNKYSDTPENELTDIQQGRYLTDYTYNTNTASNNATSNGSSNITDNSNISETISTTKLDSISEYKKYLEVCNDIYSMIYKECNSLFYGLA